MVSQKRSEGKREAGDEQHMHDLFPVVVEKGALDARPGWWGSSKSCGTQSVTPSELWQEAGCGGTECTCVREPDWSPVAVSFFAFKLRHLQTSFKGQKIAIFIHVMIIALSIQYFEYFL